MMRTPPLLVVFNMRPNAPASTGKPASSGSLALATQVLLTSLVLLLSFGTSARAETPEFVDTFHDPDRPDKDDDVEMTLEIDQVENVTGVEMYVCSITDEQCYAPVDMDSSDDEIWTAMNEASLKAGDTYGYKFVVETDDGGDVDFPDKDNLDDYDSYDIEELSGAYYFGFDIEPDPETGDDDDGGLPAPGLPLVLAGLALALTLRRRR